MTQARARAYGLLSRLLLSGGDIDPDMAAHFVDGEVDPEDAATRYVATFDLGVPPYASTFLAEDGRVGGERTTRIADEIARDGFLPITDEVAACHLGVLLGHMYALVATGRDGRAREFARDHIASWITPLASAVAAIDDGLWSAVVAMVADLSLDDATNAPDGDGPADQPPPHPLLDDASGLRDVAEFLAKPARCGLFLTDAECARIGRAYDLPRGFGHRRARIETQLGSAAEYGRVGDLATAWLELVDRRDAALRETEDDAPSLRRLQSAWRARLQTTREMLETLREGARRAMTQQAAG